MITSDKQFSAAEMASLHEVAKGVFQQVIPVEHAQHLLDAKLVFKLFGELRITAEGRKLISRKT